MNVKRLLKPGDKIGVWRLLEYKGFVESAGKRRHTWRAQCTACGTIVEEKRQDTMRYSGKACGNCLQQKLAEERAAPRDEYLTDKQAAQVARACGW